MHLFYQLSILNIVCHVLSKRTLVEKQSKNRIATHQNQQHKSRRRCEVHGRRFRHVGQLLSFLG